MEDITKLREFYNLICSQSLGDDEDSLQTRVNIIKLLETETGNDFKCTEDFSTKMNHYFINQEKPGTKLKEVRQLKNWNQETMAAHLGVSKQFLSQMERGNKPLNIKALRFLEKKDISNHAQGQIG